MTKVFRIMLAGACLIGFMFIRFCERDLFYDPLISYFHGDYKGNPLPEMDQSALFLNVLSRYLLNFIGSLGLLWAAFAEKHILQFASILYSVIGGVLMTVMYIILQTYDPDASLSLFYVRRFLIQPLLIFLLLPAFFYSLKAGN